MLVSSPATYMEGRRGGGQEGLAPLLMFEFLTW